MTGIEMIIEERKHQLEKLGFTIEADVKKYKGGQLLMLAHYIMLGNNANMPKDSWSVDYIKQIHRHSLPKQLAIAGALIAAHIDVVLAIEKEIAERIKEETQINILLS